MTQYIINFYISWKFQKYIFGIPGFLIPTRAAHLTTGSAPTAPRLLHIHCTHAVWVASDSHTLGWAGPCAARAAPLLVSLTVTLTLNSLGVYKPDSYKDLSLGTGWAPRGRVWRTGVVPSPVFTEFLHLHFTHSHWICMLWGHCGGEWVETQVWFGGHSCSLLRPSSMYQTKTRRCSFLGGPWVHFGSFWPGQGICLLLLLGNSL